MSRSLGRTNQWVCGLLVFSALLEVALAIGKKKQTEEEPTPEEPFALPSLPSLEELFAVLTSFMLGTLPFTSIPFTWATSKTLQVSHACAQTHTHAHTTHAHTPDTPAKYDSCTDLRPGLLCREQNQ